jgi:hypothetical protein
MPTRPTPRARSRPAICACPASSLAAVKRASLPVTATSSVLFETSIPATVVFVIGLLIFVDPALRQSEPGCSVNHPGPMKKVGCDLAHPQPATARGPTIRQPTAHPGVATPGWAMMQT